jgi:hypothetical protein
LCQVAVAGWDAVVDPAERFAAMVAATAGDPDVQPPDSAGGRRFGSEALRVGGSIVAMLVQGRVVLKLPRERVQALIDAGDGAPFDNGRGRPMREWVALTGDPAGDDALLREALALARSRARGAGPP